ncbi:hypothetical protein Hanom_Chr14g01294331 [Helianthus anomalus]
MIGEIKETSYTWIQNRTKWRHMEWNACSKNFVYNLGIGQGTSVLAIELSRPPPCKKGPIYFTQMRLLIVHQISCVPL